MGSGIQGVESGIQGVRSGIQGEESEIQRPPGLPHKGRISRRRRGDYKLIFTEPQSGKFK